MGLPIEARCQLGVEASYGLLYPNVGIVVISQSTEQCEEIFHGTAFLFLDQNSKIAHRDKGGQNLKEVLPPDMFYTRKCVQYPGPTRNEDRMLDEVSVSGHLEKIF